MNHINWVQQDPDYQTKYHVLKWESSHFHEPQSRQMVNSALHKEGAAFAVSAEQTQAGVPEIGLCPASSVKSGGFALGRGQEGVVLQKNAGAEKGQDSVTISLQGVERQNSGADTRMALQQSVAQQTEAQRLALERTVTQQAGRTEKRDKGFVVTERVMNVAVGQGNIRNRLKESGARLQEAYQKQKQKIKKTLFHTKKSEKKPELPKKAGRSADREEALSMQARNHYLLDSYDRNGQYHMLGK